MRLIASQRHLQLNDRLAHERVLMPRRATGGPWAPLVYKDGSPGERVMAAVGIPASADPETVVGLERLLGALAGSRSRRHSDRLGAPGDGSVRVRRYPATSFLNRGLFRSGPKVGSIRSQPVERRRSTWTAPPE